MSPPTLEPNWQNPIWSRAETLELRHFLPDGSDHRPRTFARVLHTKDGLHGIFQVHDPSLLNERKQASYRADDK